MAGSKVKTIFICDSCGNESPKWEGKCPSCGEWNVLVEVRRAVGRKGENYWINNSPYPVEELSNVSSDSVSRIELPSPEFNRVLGGGIVPGSLVAIAGDPGIGKSTLLLKVAGHVANEKNNVLYVTGEESVAQIKMRADRIHVSGNGLLLLQATSLETVISHLDRIRPVLAILDSIQTVYDDSIDSPAGSVTQIRECTRLLMQWAKTHDIPLIVTGHVTKGGDIAGPRVLEHMVDVVLHMEGDSVGSWRLLRAIKNRFGSTNEVGVFEMLDIGMVDVGDPSKTFLAERKKNALGSVVVPVLEGSRPLLVEVQALTSPSVLATPRRVATGMDFNRLLLVCAVLTRRARISLANQDVLVNVTGGMRLNEPAGDLGVALAIISSLRNVPVDTSLAAVGEIGLSGEIRNVPQLQRRINEVARLGLSQCLIPDITDQGQSYPAEFCATKVTTVAQAIAVSMPRWSQGNGIVE